MNKGAWLIVGMLLGAVTGLFLAPQSGRRTRALVRDKSIKYSHDASDFTGKKSRHLANKVQGYLHEVKGKLQSKRLGREAEEVKTAVMQSVT